MRPYHIEINWIDYNATIEQDIYEIIVYDKTKEQIITSWKCAACNTGLTISRYFNGTKDILDS